MDNLEKVEKLRERADVTYEEAREALEKNQWDLLDAMVALEKAGKTKAPAKENFSTSYEQQKELTPVREKVKERQNEKPRIFRSIAEAFRRFIGLCRGNSFSIRRGGDLVVRLPLLTTVVILLFTWKVSVPVLLVMLFFGFRYSFEGKDDLKEANNLMEKARNAAESIKEGFQSSMNRESGSAETGMGQDDASPEGSQRLDGASSENSQQDGD